MPSPEVVSRIEAILHSDDVVLFMKGTRGAPQCGFSATVVGILDNYVPEYTTVNVLADPEIREGIKEYASWPTIPQLYVKQEFVGGCDIIRQLEEEGELASTLGDAVRAPEPPEVTVTDAAAAVFREALEESDGDEFLRVSIDPRFRHDLALDQPTERDLRVEVQGLTLLFDPSSAHRAAGLVIDYVQQPQAGFRMENPNAPPTVTQLSPTDTRTLLEAEPDARFIDVRTPEERAQASIPGTTLLSDDNIAEIAALPKDTPLVFHCHHGMRSHQAALHFLEQGFTRVYNVVGGIDAWSQEIDASIPRYT